MKRLIAFCLTVVMVAGSAITTNAAGESQANLGALADSYAAGSGTFTLTEDSRIFVAAEAAPSGDLLQTAQLINRQFSEEFPSATEALDLVWGNAVSAKAGDVVLNLSTAARDNIAAEGYKLEVTDKAVVTASDVDGLLYGANMLQKYFDVAGGLTLSGFTAADTPDTKERTVMLDTGRKYYTAEWIKNFIKQISWMGYNTLQVHVSEDGGFRADFWDDKYYTANYRPENDFTWLCGSYVQSWVKDPYRKDPNAGDYLTTEELIDICNTAKEYHIDIVPSFDSPAHMDYITWKFEQHYKDNKNYYFSYNGLDYFASATNGCINYTGRTGDSSPTWPYYTTIDIREGTVAKAFVFSLYEDMADFFKEYAGSTDFSIGADEVNLSSGYGIDWNYSVFPGYVNELNRMLNSKGYTCRMFNDFIGSTTYNQSSNAKAVYDFDDNIEIMYWNSDFNPNTGKWSDPTWHVKFFWETNDGTSDNWGDGGRTMYNCIQTNTYYVLREGTSGSHRDARDPQNRNWTFYGTNEADIYNKWYPADISEKGDYTENAADVPADQLGGAYFLIWNDYAALSTEADVWNGALDCWDKDVRYYLFDRMYSNIIKMWNSDINSSVTYDKFATTRDAIDWFPGFISCSAKAKLLEASELERSNETEFNVLKQLVEEEKIINTDGKYTEGSYLAYETSYSFAKNVYSQSNPADSEVTKAIHNLTVAKNALVDLTLLKEALSKEENNVTNTGSYTEESFANYQSAYAAAEAVLADADATVEEINAAIANLETAVHNLVVEDGTTEEKDSENIDVKLMAKSFKKDKKVGLKVTTVAGVESVTITNGAGETITPSTIVGKDQKLDGKDAKVWLIKFTAPGKGSYTYTLTVGEEQETFKFVVK